MRPIRRTRSLTATVLVTLMLGACTNGGPSRAAVANKEAGGPVTFVVLGDDRADGSQVRDSLHEAWPQRVFTKSLPQRTVYVDLGSERTTVADARRDQVPATLDLQPTVVAVWLGHADSQQATSNDRFESELGALVDDLRHAATRGAGGATTKLRVLLLAADPYVDAVRRAAHDHDAEVVDVHDIDVDTGGSPAQQQVADAVSKAIGKLS